MKRFENVFNWNTKKKNNPDIRERVLWNLQNKNGNKISKGHSNR